MIMSSRSISDRPSISSGAESAEHLSRVQNIETPPVPSYIPPLMVRHPLTTPISLLHHPSHRQVLVPFESSRAFWRRD